MSTIIIIGGGKPPQRAAKAVETEDGAEIQDADGMTQATFSGPNAYDNAIKYLKVMKG